MSSLKSETGWIQLARFQASTEFSVLYDTKRNIFYVINEKQELFHYSFTTNAWIKHTITSTIDASFDGIRYHAMALDEDQNKIYIHHGVNDSIAILSLNDKNKYKLETITGLDDICHGDGSKGIMINGEFHSIGGEPVQHIKYDPITKTADLLHVLSETLNDSMCIDHRIIRVKNKILMFGGWNEYDCFTGIMQYDIAKNEWTKLKSIKMPYAVREFGCTVILNEQFVVLFGGESALGDWSDDVFIYSVQNQTFQKSKIKCPDKAEFQAFTINDKVKDDITTFGFIRSRWIQCGMNNYSFPPQYLIRIICSYYCNEWIHLFAKNDGGHHWNIDVTKLFNFK